MGDSPSEKPKEKLSFLKVDKKGGIGEFQQKQKKHFNIKHG
jgi:hypothetical protein